MFKYVHLYKLHVGSPFMLRCIRASFLALLCVACSKQSVDTSHNDANRVLRRGLPGEPRTLDPQLADDDFSFQVVRDLYEGLTDEDSSGQIIPGAADSWTLDDTGTIYTFHIRPDAKWSNGDTTTAEEFVQGLRRAVDPKTASGSAGLLAVIKGATAIIAGEKPATDLSVAATSKTSLRIVLDHPAPFILQILSQPIAAPFHANSSMDAPVTRDAGLFNGPYVLVDRVVGAYINLRRNDRYWNASKVAVGKVRYVNAESEATELREYIAGDLDLTFSIPLPDLDRILRKLPNEVQMSPTLGTTYLALNLSKSPLKDDVKLREALSIAVDREQIAKSVMNGVTPAYALVANGTSGYVPPAYPWTNWNRNQQLLYARSLYEQSGYSLEKPLHLRLYFSSGESIQRLMIAIAGSWKQNLGVTSELENDEFRVFLTGRKNRNRWDAARLKWDADYDDPSSFLNLFTAENSQNDAAYSNPVFNSLIKQASIESQPQKRLQILHDAERVLLDDYPIVPIYFTKSRRLVKPYIGGAKINPMNRTYSKNLFWKLT